MCHTLILLGPGGHLIYNGPAFDLGPYFDSMDYPPVERGNVADFAMDVLSGFVTDRHGNKRNISDIVAYFSTQWQIKMKSLHMQHMQSEINDVKKHYARMAKLRDIGSNNMKESETALLPPLNDLMKSFKYFRVASSRQFKVLVCLIIYNLVI